MLVRVTSWRSPSLSTSPAGSAWGLYAAKKLSLPERMSSTPVQPACTSNAEVIPLRAVMRSEEHTSELQSRLHLVCRLLLVNKLPRVFCARAFLHLVNRARHLVGIVWT